MKIENILDVFNKKIDSFVVVDISSKLTLLNVELKDEIRINAFKVIESAELSSDKKDEVIVETLRSFIKENRILHKNVILKPSLNSLLIKRIQLPAVPEAELAEAIKWQIKEDISFDLSKAVMDFTIIKKIIKEDDSKVFEIICVVANEEEIRQQVLLLKQSGLNCLSVGLLPFGYEKIIEKYFSQRKDESISIFHLAENICYIVVYKNNKLEFYRELPLSINRLKESLGSVLVSDKGKAELTPDEVKEVLFEIGVPQKDLVYKDKLSSTQILSMLRPILERLVEEIRRSIFYYGSQFHGTKVNKLFIAGAALRIPNIDNFLSKELSLDIEKLSLENKITISEDIDSQALQESYASLGLAFDYKEGINILPYEFRTERIERIGKRSLRWIAFIAFLLFVVSYIFAKAGISSFQERLDNAKLHLGVLSEVRQTKTRIDQLNNFVTEVKNSELPFGIVLKKLSNIAPRGLFILDLSLDCDTKIGKIKGYVKDIGESPDALLTKFVGDMESSGYFKEVSISSFEKDKEQGFDIARFNLTFKLSL